MNNPLVSVIIPTYNRANILGHAIDSVLAQSYSNLQIIVIDDGSTDDTAGLLKNYPQVEYIVKEHAGQAAARNLGLKHAKGTIVASLDSDDTWNPDFLQRCVTKLEADNLDFVFANWLQTQGTEPWDFLIGDPDLQPFFKETPDNWITLSPAEARHVYLSSCPSPTSSVVLRKSSIVSGWDESISIGDDWCMLLEATLAKDTYVAFTLDILWVKKLDDLNIYDGRKWSEVLKYLYIKDTLRMMEKFKKIITPAEMRVLEKRYIASLVELAKHEILREHNLSEATRLIKIAMAVNKLYTIAMVPYILVIGVNRKINAAKLKAARKK